MTIKQARKMLFDIDSERADQLRRELFELDIQDFQLPDHLFSRLCDIKHEKLMEELTGFVFQAAELGIPYESIAKVLQPHFVLSDKDWATLLKSYNHEL